MSSRPRDMVVFYNRGRSIRNWTVLDGDPEAEDRWKVVHEAMDRAVIVISDFTPLGCRYGVVPRVPRAWSYLSSVCRYVPELLIGSDLMMIACDVVLV